MLGRGVSAYQAVNFSTDIGSEAELRPSLDGLEPLDGWRSRAGWPVRWHTVTSQASCAPPVPTHIDTHARRHPHRPQAIAHSSGSARSARVPTRVIYHAPSGRHPPEPTPTHPPARPQLISPEPRREPPAAVPALRPWLLPSPDQHSGSCLRAYAYLVRLAIRGDRIRRWTSSSFALVARCPWCLWTFIRIFRGVRSSVRTHPYDDIFLDFLLWTWGQI